MSTLCQLIVKKDVVIDNPLYYMDWTTYPFVVRSKPRVAIIQALSKPKTPTQIASDINQSVSHVSRTLAEFNDKKITECITPDQKIGRVYRLTESGQAILKKLPN